MTFFRINLSSLRIGTKKLSELKIIINILNGKLDF